MNYYVVQILCVNGRGSHFWSPSHRHGHRTMDQTTSLDSTGFEHQHWITGARGIIETLTVDPMTGIFYPFISCLLHTKTDQHSLPPLHMISGTPPRFTQLSQWSAVIDLHNGEDGPPTNQVAHRTPFIPIAPILEECLAYAIAPPTNRVHHSPCYPWHPILDHTSMRHPLQ